MQRFKLAGLIIILLGICGVVKAQETEASQSPVKPVRIEVVKAIKKTEFRAEDCPQRVQGGNPRMVEDKYLVFDGAQDGNRQVDPQVA